MANAARVIQCGYKEMKKGEEEKKGKMGKGTYVAHPSPSCPAKLPNWWPQ
jgi:hypothetical protein